MTKKEVIEMLKQEIEWCKNNPEKINMPEDWKEGFISGLKQAVKLVKDSR